MYVHVSAVWFKYNDGSNEIIIIIIYHLINIIGNCH